jgi:Uma2 family endonuclease
VAASSASIDLHEKFRVYRRCGVQEYLVWLTAEDRVLWFELSGEDYVELKPERGFLHSRVFPGLVLDVKALLKRDRARLLTALRAGSD